MNNSFVVVDKLNSVAYYCFPFVRFSFENFDYLMYYLPIDNSKCRIFTSKLIRNNDDSYLIVDISEEEKSKLSLVSQRIFIDLPKSYSDNVDVNKLVNDFCCNNNIVFLKEFPNLNEQLLCSNSNLANSYLEYCNYVRSFYGNILSRVVISPSRPTLVWNIPTTNSDVELNILPDNFNVLNVSGVTTDNVSNVNNGTNNQTIGLGNVETIISTPESTNNIIRFPGFGPSKDFSFKFSGSYGGDGQDSSSGGPQLQAGEPIRVLKKAGFASNSYIIIGTICLILAAIIVGISIIFVKNL